MRTAITHHVPDRVKPSLLIFDIRALCETLRARERRYFFKILSMERFAIDEINFNHSKVTLFV